MGKRIMKYSVMLVKESNKTYDIDNKTIDSSSKAQHLLKEMLNVSEWHNERFGFVALDVLNRVIGLHIITEGTLSETAVYPREVATRLLLNNAHSCILFHNHPAGSMKPSTADISATKNIKSALETLQIKLMDHIILGENDTFSFAERGLI